MACLSSVFNRRRAGFAALLAGWLLWGVPAAADVITLKNGLQFEGRVGRIASLGASPLSSAGEVPVQQIVIVDDDLRRTFFATHQVQAVAPQPMSQERIRIDQRVAGSARRVAAIGAILQVTPFDEYGRRVFSIDTPQGRVDVVQGITEVTPTYTKVEGLASRQAVSWDMRIATSSIPRDILSQVLLRQIDPEDADQRLRLVRLYIQADRYRDAQAELQNVIDDFPELAELQQQVVALQQMSARRLIREVHLRRAAGQHRLAYSMLDQFPSEGVAGEILLEVRDLLEEDTVLQEQAAKSLERLQQDLAAITDSSLRALLEPPVDEIVQRLNRNTWERLADYVRLADDPELLPEQKVALAVSGWLLGTGQAVENPMIAASLYRVRQAVRRYLTADQRAQREEILAELQALEGSSPAYVARLLDQMKPIVETEPDPELPTGSFVLTVPGQNGGDEIQYHVQLPPEYDPYRRYPCIVSLHGAGTTAEQQINWWAGGPAQNGMRLGQATRRGYIVVAPVWSEPHQRQYLYSAREHGAVLFSLRDALRRFSIDTDRVFLSGHSMGGDAAWDIGLAHPDLWAGVVPIVATADKYISRYWRNGRYVPFYFVAGELDGDRMARNSADLDRYLTRAFFDAIVVVYQGRGHENFYDEVHRLFDWMERYRRNFFPEEFESVSMRAWDNFFWWVELEQFPEASLTSPSNWPPPRSARPATTTGRVLETNRVIVRTGAAQATVWLSPQMIDFNERFAVVINGQEQRDPPGPRLEVLLEDVRTRGDRQNPFWARIDTSSSRGR